MLITLALFACGETDSTDATSSSTVPTEISSSSDECVPAEATDTTEAVVCETPEVVPEAE